MMNIFFSNAKFILQYWKSNIYTALNIYSFLLVATKKTRLIKIIHTSSDGLPSPFSLEEKKQRFFCLFGQ